MAGNSNSNSSILSIIEHYQRNIDRNQRDEARLLHCINKLYVLPVKVEHLQETGIGKTVNSLRKFEGEIGVAAKTLVTKWKAMVAAEEEPVETYNNNDDTKQNSNSRESSDNDQHDKRMAVSSNSKECNKSKDKSLQKHIKKNDNERISTNNNSEGHSHHKSKSKKYENVHCDKRRDNLEKDVSRKLHKHHHDKAHENSNKTKEKGKFSSPEKDVAKRDKTNKEKNHNNEKSTSSHHKRKEERTGSIFSREKTHDENEYKPKEKSSHSSLSSRNRLKDRQRTEEEIVTGDQIEQKSQSKSGSKTSANGVTGHKRSLDVDDSDVVGTKTLTKKKQKITDNVKTSSKASYNAEDNGIDSSMGANFSDVLGMLNLPSKKSKKTLNNLKSPPTFGIGHSKSVKSKESTGFKLASNNSPLPSSSKNSAHVRQSGDTKPELLSSSAKLEPLDPGIALALPPISNNYRPLPLNQTVMDCVFNTSNSSSSKVPSIRTLSDAEALSHGISSKTMRTKIYSGVKTGQILQVSSLFDLCIRFLQKNIDALEYTGGVPFEVLRPVLERATPHQLFIFEEYNPYLMEDSDVLWKQHVQRNYRTQKRQEMESWREMFLRCQKDQERKLNILAESIKQSQKVIAAPVRKTQLAFVDSIAKPPRNVQRKQEQYGTKSKLMATPASRVAALCSVTPNAAKAGDVRLRVAAGVRDAAQVSHAIVRPKKAPLMAKTLQFIKGRHKR